MRNTQHHAPASEAPRIVRLERDLLAKNARLAAANRSWLAARGIYAANLIGSPGAGKTALIEALIPRIDAALGPFVLEGDQAGELDAERIARAGARVLQLNTGAGCHLDAQMVGEALQTLHPTPGSMLLIENVGNLVCPALFDLGEAAKVIAMSVTEGEDKPLKYPHAFAAARLLVLTKLDLAVHVEFDFARCLRCVREVNPEIEVLGVSARTGSGLSTLRDWLQRGRLTPPLAAAARREVRS